MRITPNNIIELKENEIFVFGSNPQGRHGKGAALIAKQKFGAIYGQSEGLQGQSYAIITKELRSYMPPIPLSYIEEGVNEFLKFAKDNPQIIFYVSKLGCSLAYFKVEDVAPLFKEAMDIENIYLPIEFIIENSLKNG